MKETLEKLRITHVTCSFYHRQRNGRIEMHDILEKGVTDNEQYCDVHLNHTLTVICFNKNKTKFLLETTATPTCVTLGLYFHHGAVGRIRPDWLGEHFHQCRYTHGLCKDLCADILKRRHHQGHYTYAGPNDAQGARY